MDNPQTTTYLKNGIRTGVNDIPMQLGSDVYSSPLMKWEITPFSGVITPGAGNVAGTYSTAQLPVSAPVPTALNSGAFYCVQSINSAGFIAIGVNNPLPFVGGGAGIALYPQLVTYKSTQCIEFDCQRSLGITISNASGGQLNSITFTLNYTGWDDRGVAISASETVPVFNAIANNTSVFYNSLRTIKWLSSISMSANPLGVTLLTMGVGMGTSFAFPVFVPRSDYLTPSTAIETLIAAGTATLTPGNDFYNTTYGANYVNLGVSDSRGTLTYPIVANTNILNAVNFPTYISGIIHAYGADSYLNTQLGNGEQGANYQVTKVTPNNPGTTPKKIKSSTVNALTQYDLTGVQYPGDFVSTGTGTNLMQYGGNFQNSYTFNP